MTKLINLFLKNSHYYKYTNYNKTKYVWSWAKKIILCIMMKLFETLTQLHHNINCIPTFVIPELEFITKYKNDHMRLKILN